MPTRLARPVLSPVDMLLVGAEGCGAYAHQRLSQYTTSLIRVCLMAKTPIFQSWQIRHNKKKTRKLSDGKDYRAMRPVYGCPENFRESLSTPTATFAEIFNGLLFRSIL